MKRKIQLHHRTVALLKKYKIIGTEMCEEMKGNAISVFSENISSWSDKYCKCKN